MKTVNTLTWRHLEALYRLSNGGFLTAERVLADSKAAYPWWSSSRLRRRSVHRILTDLVEAGLLVHRTRVVIDPDTERAQTVREYGPTWGEVEP